MSDYDFSSLNDKEFEHLSADLLGCHLATRVERFKAGRDGGVDGRFFSVEGNEVIVQCKHWLKSGLQALIRSIKNTEAAKVKKLKPKRYIFITSLELSRANKSEIKKLFSPYILSDEDVLGNHDLNDILSDNPSVERKHYKLWISSTNVLQTILNAGVVGRSKHKLAEIVEDSRKYVVTENHHQAIEKLESAHSIIITGLPGIGKTTLADQLCQFYVAQDYEFCYIENSLNEAESFYDDEAYQVFYFDDFLGRNFLLALDPHQDSHVINFIKRVARDKKKRFILTSRSNILNQGKRLSDLFEINKTSRNEYELSISSLSDLDKAKILYNHIWFGDLEEIYIDQLYKDKRYSKIIAHDNFNPRLISFVTDQERLSEINADKYWDYIESTLMNPKDIWRHVFESQLDDVSINIVVAVSLHGKSISEDELNGLYIRLMSSNLISSPKQTFDVTVRLLVGALLNRNVLGDGLVYYDLFNPSIADYVISNYLSNFEYICELITYLRTVQCISNITGLMSSKVISEEYFFNILESQLIKLSIEENSSSLDKYKLSILSRAAQWSMVPSQKSLRYIESLTVEALSCDSKLYGVDYFEFIEWVYSMGLINNDDKSFEKALNNWVVDYVKDMDEFSPISKILVSVEIPPADLTLQFKKQYVEYLSEDITADVIEAGIQSHVFDDSHYDNSEVLDYIEDRFDELAIDFNEADAEAVSDHCDIDDIIQSNMKSSRYNYEHENSFKGGDLKSVPEVDAIDDLFDRS